MRGIVYLNLYEKCLVRLCVSLYSLRKVYDGPVAILNGGGDNGICQKIGEALEANVVTIPVVQRRRNTAYCTKASLWRHSPFSTNILLDSDTIVLKEPTIMFELAEKEPYLCVTRFSNWVTTGKLIKGRIERWRDVQWSGVDKLINDSLDAPHGAVNTGVLSWSDGAEPFLKDWESLTNAGWRCPFTDELACQLLLRKHKHVMLDARYNYSYKYPIDAEPVIAHYHGNKACRPGAARDSWLPVYEDCLRRNVAEIKGWTPSGDPALTEYLNENIR